MRKRPLLWFACVFLSGLACERYAELVLLLVPLSFIGVEIYVGVKHKTSWRAAGRSLVLLSAFFLGMWHMEVEEVFRARYMLELEDVTPKAYGREQENKDVLVLGEIVEIKSTDYGVRMRLSDCYICLKEEMIPCNDVLVYASSTQFHVGEIHKIKGQLNLFERARNEGNFDGKVFYQSQKIDFSIWLESSQKIGEDDSQLRTSLNTLKESLIKKLENNMDERAAGFYAGMLLGDKSNLEKEVKELFELGGISHILAISGLHISMIGRNFYQILRKLGIRFSSAGILAGSLILVYGFMVGNGMSAVRAIGMMLIFFLGQMLGRSYDMLNALGAMMLFLLWDNPFFLEYSGFWFSVMALMGVGFVGENMNMSLGITLTTLPVVAYCYYEIPLYSPLVNAVALPLLTPIFLILILGMICPFASKLLFFPCSWGFGFYIWLCELVKKLPFASVICGKPKVSVVVVYYVVLALSVCLLSRLHREKVNKKTQIEKTKIVRKHRILVLGISLICLWMIIYPKPKSFEITFLDVGQGDAVYISMDDKTTYFIDGGSTTEESVGEYCMLPFLKSKGVAHIDYWFVSHADADHVSGIFEVLESGYDVRHLVVSKYAPKDETMLQLIAVAKDCGTQVIYMDAGDRIVSKEAAFACLYPWDASANNKNEASLVLDVEVENIDGKSVKALFAGDISSETEQVLVERGILDEVWLYKASHHGSKYSNSAEILEVLKPEITVVSCAFRNMYGHPHEEAVKRIEETGSKLFYTMENGQVTLRLLQ